MNPTDKVTLEWLMRLDIPSPPKEGRGERGDPTWTFDLGNGVTVTLERTSYMDGPGLTIFKSNKRNDPWHTELVYLTEPTIARFHEAVAFLGATLPPLRPG